MTAIASFRTAILALLIDPNKTIFTNNDVDQALRWALLEYSSRRPLIRTYDFTVDATTGIHNLPADFITRHITKVELWAENSDDKLDLTYYAFYRDEGWMIQTQYQVEAGEILEISYSAVHQVDGLDSAAGTTVPLADEPLLHIGSAGHAAQMRSMSRVETINMDSNVVRDYRLMAADFLSQFTSGLFPEPGVRFASLDFPSPITF
jgi:hypothetical protein